VRVDGTGFIGPKIQIIHVEQEATFIP